MPRHPVPGLAATAALVIATSACLGGARFPAGLAGVAVEFVSIAPSAAWALPLGPCSAIAGVGQPHVVAGWSDAIAPMRPAPGSDDRWLAAMAAPTGTDTWLAVIDPALCALAGGAAAPYARYGLTVNGVALSPSALTPDGHVAFALHLGEGGRVGGRR